MMDYTLKQFVKEEKKRQKKNVELIASENFCSKEVRKLAGSILTNKYAEGYPAKRYYGGCQCVDGIELLCQKRLLEIFKAGDDYHANVQPHSGSQANMAIYKAMLKIGDTVLSMDLNSGGHLTHGSPVSFSGKEYNIVSYGVEKETGRINYDKLMKLAKKTSPKMIIVGASSYPYQIDFARCKQIADEVGAYLMADVAHIAGLIVAGLHPSPVGYADFITSTTHKTLRGPRGGVILCKKEYAKKIDSAVFPGIQGGPLEHIIAAKCQCFYEASGEDFVKYQKQVCANVQAMISEFRSMGVRVIGSENHLFLLDTMSSFGLTGKEAEEALDRAGITCNKNMLPFDKEKPSTTSGLRLGTAAMTTKGYKEKDFRKVAQKIFDILTETEMKKVGMINEK